MDKKMTPMKQYKEFLNELYAMFIFEGIVQKAVLNKTSYYNGPQYSLFNEKQTRYHSFYSRYRTSAGVQQDHLVLFSNQREKDEHFKSFAIEFKYLADPENPQIRFSLLDVVVDQLNSKPFNKVLVQEKAFSPYLKLKDGIELLKKLKIELQTNPLEASKRNTVDRYTLYENLRNKFSQVIFGCDSSTALKNFLQNQKQENKKLYDSLGIKGFEQKEVELKKEIEALDKTWNQEISGQKKLQEINLEEASLKAQMTKIKNKLAILAKSKESLISKTASESDTFKNKQALEKDLEKVIRAKQKAQEKYEKLTFKH